MLCFRLSKQQLVLELQLMLAKLEVICQAQHHRLAYLHLVGLKIGSQLSPLMRMVFLIKCGVHFCKLVMLLLVSCWCSLNFPASSCLFICFHQLAHHRPFDVVKVSLLIKFGMDFLTY